MNDYITVAKVGSIDDGTGQAFNVGGKMVAVFNTAGEYSAINDFCPHMGASLAGGHVEDGAVTCPWHAWRFCVKEGTWLDNPSVKTDAYEVRVEGDNIQVKLPKEEEKSESEGQDGET